MAARSRSAPAGACSKAGHVTAHACADRPASFSVCPAGYLYEEIRSGRLRSVKAGRARRVPASANAEYVALLEREAQAA